MKDKGEKKMANKEKSFNTKLYAVITFIAIAVFLSLTCVLTFKARYTAFHPEELARTYVDTIVQTGDGYNAYKNTLASKSSKYGDFIRKYYINPAVYRDTDFEIGGSTDGLTGYNDDTFKGEKTLNDDGTLSGQLTEKMYAYYVQLVEEYGWDDYASVYSSYIAKLTETREEIFGDKYFTDEIFFTAFEANVSEYGDSLTGTQDVFDENTGVQLSSKSTGVYQTAYGEDYKFTCVADEVKTVDADEYKKAANTQIFETYGVSTDDISEVQSVKVKVSTENGEEVASLDVTVVKIGMSWYVDNTVTDTAVLYNFYK